jgi:spore coat protein CotH
VLFGMPRPTGALLLSVLLASCHSTDGGDAADVLFSGETIQSFELTLPPASLDRLRADPRTYQPGTLVWNGQTFERVGVRLKGRASFRTIDERAALKVKLDEFVPHQRLLGLRRLTFNNMVQDPTWARERLAYLLYRASGVPASRCASARLTVNGEQWGVYANVETIDDELVESRFGKPIGNLYDTTKIFVDLTPQNLAFFERETKGDPADGSDLPRLLQVMAGPESSFLQDDAQVIDVDQFLLVAAVQATTAQWDGFFAAANNYEVYRDPGRGRFVVLPWGEDQAFGKRDGEVLAPDYPIDQSLAARQHAVFFDRCLRKRACAIKYLDAVERVLSVWERLPLVGELDAIDRQLEPFAAEGRAPPDAAERRRWIDQLRKFLGERAPAVRRDVARMRAALPP